MISIYFILLDNTNMTKENIKEEVRNMIKDIWQKALESVNTDRNLDKDDACQAVVKYPGVEDFCDYYMGFIDGISETLNKQFDFNGFDFVQEILKEIKKK